MVADRSYKLALVPTTRKTTIFSSSFEDLLAVWVSSVAQARHLRHRSESEERHCWQARAAVLPVWRHREYCAAAEDFRVE